MNKVVWKACWNPEKEEKWLNDMASKGLALSSYTWCRYVFEETVPGEYIYQIELLEKLPKQVESEMYLRFLEDSQIKVVTSYLRWVYLRKKTTDGPFSIYSDYESKLKYLKRLKYFWLAFVLMNLPIGFFNLVISFADYRLGYSDLPWFNLFAGLLNLGVSIFISLTLLIPVQRQIKRLAKRAHYSTKAVSYIVR